jgi:hypothetical protein
MIDLLSLLDLIPNRPINGTNINGQLIEGLSDGGSLPG